jgi:hypothetical protein
MAASDFSTLTEAPGRSGSDMPASLAAQGADGQALGSVVALIVDSHP